MDEIKELFAELRNATEQIAGTGLPPAERAHLQGLVLVCLGLAEIVMEDLHRSADALERFAKTNEEMLILMRPEQGPAQSFGGVGN